jgi:hypothetical protein
VLNTTEQVGKAKRAPNSLLWSTYIHFGKCKAMNISYSEERHFKLLLRNLDTAIQVTEKIIKYRNEFLEKGCKNLQATKSKK